MLNDSLLENMKTINPGVPPAVPITEALYPKKNANLDSWFFIGRTKANGHDLSFLFHFMLVSGFENNVFLNTVYSITDKTTGWYTSDDCFIPVTNHVQTNGDTFTIQSDKYAMTASLEQMHLSAKTKDSSIDVAVFPKGYVLNNGGSGYFPILIMKDNYQYSMPFFTMKGVIEIKGEKMEIEGDCWLDRQYDFFELPVEDGRPLTPGNWTWLGISLDNKTALSIWDYTDANGQLNAFASILDSTGKQVVIAIDSIVAKADEIWISEKTNQHYPTHWLVDIPEFEIHLEVTAVIKEQEIIANIPSMNKYEGESIVKGTVRGEEVNGSCCIELLGLWQ